MIGILKFSLVKNKTEKNKTENTEFWKEEKGIEGCIYNSRENNPN